MSTTGKIFPESSNIYQDEAKVLFNYYQQAAEKIVQQEEEIESKVAVLKEEYAQLMAQKDRLWPWLLLLIFPYFIKKNKLDEQINNRVARIAEFKKQHDSIFRDYKVTKLGVAYVPVADQIKYEDKSFIVDYTGQVPNSQVSLQMSRHNDLLCESISNIEQLTKSAPIVETSREAETVETDDYSLSIQEINQNDYFGKLDRSIRTISYCMGDLDSASVQLPLVQDHSQHLENLNEYATMNIPAGAPVIPIFDKERYQNDIAKFQELNKLKDSLSSDTAQFEDVLKNLMSTIATSVQTISSLKLASTDKIVDSSNKLLFRLLKAPYNHYSPLLEAEEIQRIREEKFDYADSVQGYTPFALRQSSRVRYNLITDQWIAEDGSSTTMPFGIHQIYEEIVAPMVQSLMQENRIERLKIYNHIKDQKISYLNKWHQDTDAFYRDNRKQSADIINLMQESLREYVAAYNTLVSFQKTQDSMNASNELASGVVEAGDSSTDTVLAFEAQAKQYEGVQNDFEEYMDRLKEDIDRRAEEFGHVEYYDARLQDGHSNEAAVAASEVRSLDQRRQGLTAANPLLAKMSQLPPAPKVEDITFEHLSLNLPSMAQNALNELAEQTVSGQNPDDDAEPAGLPENLEPDDNGPVAPTDNAVENQQDDDEGDDVMIEVDEASENEGGEGAPEDEIENGEDEEDDDDDENVRKKEKSEKDSEMTANILGAIGKSLRG